MFSDMFQKKDSHQLRARIMLVRIQAFKRLTREQLAKEVGISAQTIMMFLHKERDVRIKTFAQILEYIKFEVDQSGLQE